MNQMKQSGLQGFFYFTGNCFPVKKKRSAGMRTAADKVDVASDRRRRENVPRHILCSAGKRLMKREFFKNGG